MAIDWGGDRLTDDPISRVSNWITETTQRVDRGAIPTTRQGYQRNSGNTNLGIYNLESLDALSYALSVVYYPHILVMSDGN